MGEHSHPCSLQAAWLTGGFWVLTSSTSREVGTRLPGSLCATLGPCGRIFVLLGSHSSLLGLSPLCTAEMWWGQGPALTWGHLWLGLIDFFFSLWQPALLYLVPACIGFPLLVALAKGEVTEMFRWASAGVGAVLPTALEHRKHADVPTPGHSWRDRFIWAGSGCACARLRRRREPGVCSDMPSLAPATSREPSVPYPRGRQRFGSCRALPLLWQARERVGPRTWCRERLGHCVSQRPWVGEDGIGASCGSSRGWFEHIPASPLG